MKKIIKRLCTLIFCLLIIIGTYYFYQVYKDMKAVITYEKQVQETAQQYQIPQYANLLLAIIYTESKGKTLDLMQSSESLYGEAHVIYNQEESIQAGVYFFSQAIQQSQAAGCDIWTAVQAYNYGLPYISFVQERGRKNSIELADEYSKEVLSPLLGNHEKERYRYYQPRALLHNGGFLYRNGGNMFYADTVKTNLKLIEWLK